MPRLILRRLAASDGDRVLGWRNSEAVRPFMYGDHLITREAHTLWLAAGLDASDRRHWIVDLDGQPIGLASVVRIDPASGRADWAYYLAEPAARGQGVGAAVERLVLGWAFEVCGVRKLWCEVLVENDAVWRLHESFGFRREALLRAHVVKDGVARDVVGLGLLACEWPQARSRADERLAAKGWDRSALHIDD